MGTAPVGCIKLLGHSSRRLCSILATAEKLCQLVPFTIWMVKSTAPVGGIVDPRIPPDIPHYPYTPPFGCGMIDGKGDESKLTPLL